MEETETMVPLEIRVNKVPEDPEVTVVKVVTKLSLALVTSSDYLFAVRCNDFMLKYLTYNFSF